MQTFSTIYNSPLGKLQLTCTDSAVTAVAFLKEEIADKADTHPLLVQCAAQLDEFFRGERKAFELPFSQPGSEFQQKVWNLLYQIPFGKTISYQTLSRQYGDVKAIRAIASANGKNNLAIIIPCHRVIGADGSLTGYAGGLWRKSWLLEHEAKFGSGLLQLF